MTAPSPTVCSPWADWSDLCSPCLEHVYDFDADVVDDALIAAAEVLYHLTFEQWPGVCTDRVRPASRYMTPDTRRSRRYALDAGYGRNMLYSAGFDSSMIAAGFVDGALSCNCRDEHQTGCFYVSQIELGQVPVTSITEVLIDGDVVDPARYRVDDYRWLVWVPDLTDESGRRGWPCCQRMDLPTTEQGTFEVTFGVGSGPSRAGVRASAVLACQFMLAWSPATAGECKLPKRVTSMTRQQVSMNLSDPVALFDKGLTGIAEVDLWVQAIRSERKNRHGAVVIPERQRSKVRRTTG